MKVLLVDADSVQPNLALMKLSTWHKAQGDQVNLIRVNLPYFPSSKKVSFRVPTFLADKVYCSVVFVGNKRFIKGEGIIFGGTGHDLTTELPSEVEECKPDYSIYPDCKFSYGFITRGCIRNCAFCFVPKKEGKIRQVNEIDDIVNSKFEKVKFMDNNILALPNHKEILQELVDKQIYCSFNQGLDLRLLDEENSELLRQLHYFGEYIFAFDNWKYKKMIELKMPLLSWRRKNLIKFFVYVHPDMPLADTVKRLLWLRERQCLGYVMRDIACYGSKHAKFISLLVNYSNFVPYWKKLDFHEFLGVKLADGGDENEIKRFGKMWDMAARRKN